MFHIKDNLFIKTDIKPLLFTSICDFSAVVLYDSNLIPIIPNEGDSHPPVGTIIKQAEEPFFHDLCDCDAPHIKLSTTNDGLFTALILEIQKRADDVIRYSNLKVEELEELDRVTNEDVNQAEEELNVNNIKEILKHRGIDLEDE